MAGFFSFVWKVSEKMKQLQVTKPVWHAVLWIVIYVVVVNVGDLISEALGVENLATSLLLVGLSLGLLFYVRRNGWLSYYGLASFGAEHLQRMLYYAPLLVIIAIMWLRGVKPGLGLREIALICLLMICVGFLEELLFRGFLLRGILKTSSLNRAVLISGITFGIGHIVNLARGMSPAEQTIQIVAGIFLGIVLAYCAVASGTIIPQAIFHTLLNISGNLTSSSVEVETMVLLATVVISVFYSLYLRRLLTQRAPLPV